MQAHTAKNTAGISERFRSKVAIPEDLANRLTEIETDILQRKLRKHSNQQICQDMGLLPSTLSMHFGMLCRKIQNSGHIEIIPRFFARVTTDDIDKLARVYGLDRQYKMILQGVLNGLTDADMDGKIPISDNADPKIKQRIKRITGSSVKSKMKDLFKACGVRSRVELIFKSHETLRNLAVAAEPVEACSLV
jgi:DNA-binding CsgD family transcriptional regulator